ncbi:MAG: glycosyltransferase family 4 protein [Nitrospira sp.]|nr:glycosyltransferase family 4 protein [Nitrospira sp.]
MNIMLVTPWRPSLTGGISTVIHRLMSEFRKQGHATTVFVTDHDNCLRQIETLDGCPVYGMYLRSPVSSAHPIRARLMCCLCLPSTLLQLLWLTRRQRVEAVLIQYPLPSMFYFGILKRVSGGALFVTYQGNDAHDLAMWDSRERKLVRFLLEQADLVLAVSRTLLAKVDSVFPRLCLRRRQLLPNGAPLDMIDAVEPAEVAGHLPPQYFFAAGHLIHRKGIDVVLSSLQEAQRRGVLLHLVVAGDGPERENLERQSREQGVAAQVTFLGNQSQRQVLALMKSCLAFVLASRAEGMPLVIAEAMACGKAVIASEVDGVPEIVQDGVTGVLVPPDDPLALAAGLIKVYSDGEFRDALAGRGKEWACREYNWEGIANRYLGFLKEYSERA